MFACAAPELVEEYWWMVKDMGERRGYTKTELTDGPRHYWVADVASTPLAMSQDSFWIEGTPGSDARIYR